LREGLAANRIEWLAGIINGTGNFIMTEMREKGRDFYDVLRKRRHWAMPRPIRPLTWKALMPPTSSPFWRRLRLVCRLQFKKAYTEGITKLTREDVAMPKNWVFASSIWGLLAVPRRVSSCVCIRR
jgi:homoserine dehydrogenase